MRKATLLSLVAAVASLGMVGCFPQPIPPAILLTNANSGSTQAIVVGQQIIVTLPDQSASTGFEWVLVSNNPAFLSAGVVVSPPPAGSLPGTAGTAVWTFTGIQAFPAGAAPIEVVLQQQGPGGLTGNQFTMLVFVN